MKLFKFDEFKLKISEEALAIKAFKDIWERDKSKNKGQAIAELGYIYFNCDPRSDYMFIVDETTRAEKIKEQEGLDKKWKPDVKMEEAIKVYKYLVTSEKSILLDDARAMVMSMSQTLREITKEITSVGKVKDKIDLQEKAARLQKQIPELIKNLKEAEKAVMEDIEDASQIRGEAVKHLFEDGYKF